MASLDPVRFSFATHGDPDVPWRVCRFELHEALSQPYHLIIELLTDAEVDLERLLGGAAALTLDRAPSRRVVAGLVRAWSFLTQDDAALGVRVELAPALALLGQGSDSRVWQGKSVPEIVAEVVDAPLAALGRRYRFDLDPADYPPREHCVQHRESDLAFIDRLLAEEGIFYRFEVEDDAEVVVFADTVARCPEAVGDPLPFIAQATASRERAAIERLSLDRALTCAALHQRSWSWRRASDPAADDQRAAGDRPPGAGAVYDHLALGDDPPPYRTARALERAAAPAARVRGRADAIDLRAGAHIGVAGHPRAGYDRPYLVTALTLRGEAPDAALRPGDLAAPRLIADFEGLPAGVAFRPPAPPAPHLGPQTAIVVGPPGEEIHTDEHGRVQVRFHWDRREPVDAPSCWLRVAQGSAGGGFGALFLPRVGAEVLVEFLDGDPDRPVITGALYNSHNRPPLDLPAAKTRSVIRSESTPGGGGYNEIAFEDARGDERLTLRAQRDLHESVGHDHRRRVGRDAATAVERDQAIAVARHRRVTVGDSDTLTVERGARTVDIQRGSYALGVEADLNLDVRSGDLWATVHQGWLSASARSGVDLHASAGPLSATAHGSLTAHARGGLATLAGDPGVLVRSDQGPAEVHAHDHIMVRSSEASISLEAPKGGIALESAASTVIQSQGEILLNAEAIALQAARSITLTVGTSKIAITATGIEISGNRITSAAVGMQTLTGALIRIN